MTRKSPIYLLVAATCLWGGNFVVGRGLVTHIPPFTLSFVRWLIALLMLLPFYGRGLWEKRNLYARHWKTVLVLSVTGVAAFNSLVYIAVQYTTAINASLMNAATPIVIVLLSSAVLGERLTAVRLAGIAVSMFGLLWIISGGSWQTLAGFSFNRGDLWMVVAVAAWGVYSVVGKKTAAAFPASGLFTATAAVAVLLLLPFAVAEWFGGHRPANLTWPDAAGVLYLGIFASIAAFTFWNRAVSIIGPSRSAGFLNLIPLFSAIFALLFTGETIRLYHGVGAALIIGGVYVTSRAAGKPAPVNSPL